MNDIHNEHPVCPGCPWSGWSEDEQSRRKTQLVADALKRFGLEVPVDPMVAPRPHAGYRTRAKLMVQGTPGSPARLGLYAPASHEIVEGSDCVTLAPVLRAAAMAMRGLLQAPPADAGAWLVATGHGGALEAVDLREVSAGAEPEVMLTLVVERAADPGAAAHAAEAIQQACPAVVSVCANVRGAGPQVLGPETWTLRGPTEVRDRMGPGQPWVLATAGSFVQSHRGTTMAIHAAIEAEIARLGDAPSIVELHAGSGALALRLAAGGAQVCAVESYAPAIALSEKAARAQGISGLTAEVGDAAEVLSDWASRGAQVHAVVLDPPRRGVPAELRASLGRLAPSRVLYVSCDPETLARDLAHLARLGLAARRITPFDMMPLTSHVETFAVLERAAPPAPTVLFEDERLIAVSKDPHEPTIPHPEHLSSLLTRVRALPGGAAAVPVHRLDADTSGVCLFARAPHHVQALAALLATGRKTYLALVRGVTHGKGIIRRPLRESGRMRAATTRFTRKAIVGGHSFVRAAPEEGRMHQIRRHLESLGHPVLGDPRYGHAASNRHLWERAGLDRHFLHCERIELEGFPRLEAALPADLSLVLERLGDKRGRTSARSTTGRDGEDGVP